MQVTTAGRKGERQDLLWGPAGLMGSWESFAAGWHDFWSCRGVVGVAAINFAITFLVSLLLGLLILVTVISSYFSLPNHSLSPLYRTISYTFPSTGILPPGFSFPNQPPDLFRPLSGLPSSLAPGLTGILFFLIIMAMMAFIAAATPGSLLAAVNTEFNGSTYFRQARGYFWRAFGLFWFDAAVFLLVLLLFGLIGLLTYNMAELPGILVAALVIIAGSIYVAGVLLVTKVKYLVSKEQGLLAYFTQSARIVCKRYWSWLGLCLIIIIFSLLVMALSLVLLIIPFIGPLLISFIFYSLFNINHIAVMSFAGLTSEQT